MASVIAFPMAGTNEWTFAANDCKTIQGTLAENPGLPFSEAKVEQETRTGRKCRDLTLKREAGRAAYSFVLRSILTPRVYREYKNLSSLDVSKLGHQRVEYLQFSEEEQREIVFKDITTGEVTHTLQFWTRQVLLITGV